MAIGTTCYLPSSWHWWTQQEWTIRIASYPSGCLLKLTNAMQINSRLMGEICKLRWIPTPTWNICTYSHSTARQGKTHESTILSIDLMVRVYVEWRRQSIHIHSLKWRWPQGPVLWHAVKGGEQGVSGWLIVRLMDTFNSHETSQPLLARFTGAVSHDLVLCSLFTRLSDSRFNSIWHTRSTHSLVTYLAMVVARVSRNCQFEVENKLMHHSCHGKKALGPTQW